MSEVIAQQWDEIESWTETAEEVLRIATAEPWNTAKRDEIAGKLEARWGAGAGDRALGIWAGVQQRAEEARRPAPAKWDGIRRRKVSGTPKASTLAEIVAGLKPELFISAATPLGVEQKAETQSEPERPQAKAQPEPEAEPKKPKARFEYREDDGSAPILSRSVPMENAKAFAKDRLWRNGVLATWHYHGDWWQWNGRFYETAPGERISSAVYQYLDRAKARTADGDEAFRPKPEHAETLIKCLRACVAIDDRDTPPAWLDRREGSAGDLLVFRNCLVDAVTGGIAELTPQFWVHDGVDFDFDPAAQAPRWERFLEEVFPGDQESQQCIEEQLGYGMTNDVRFEKGALWVGQKRSGKSTLVWVQERLVGAGSYASLSFHDWMKTENSRAHLLGKKVGVFPDVRLKPAKSYGLTGYDPGGLDHQSAQLLLNIIGRDTIAIGRKFKEAWQGRLSVKVIITTNELPNLQDAGGVLITRFIMLDFKQSFFGREDVNLRDKLELELPGIANRCLAAYRRLRERGRFIQPEAGRGLVTKIEGKVDPYTAFMRDCFVEDPGGEGVVVADFLKAFGSWCRDNLRHDLMARTTKSNLIQEVNKIEQWKNLRSVKPHGGKRRYPGIRLLPREDD
jgi:putative DNA primase/helicase